jgi:starch synthase (maltosyl-transferring)
VTRRLESATLAGTQFAVVENVTPQVDNGRFPAKRVLGEAVEVTADCFTHGHGLVACAVRYRRPAGDWQEEPMEPLGNDRWRAAIDVTSVGRRV